MQSLLHSRKFWLCVFGVIVALVSTYLPNISPTVMERITELVMVLIGAIALEDGAAKIGGAK